MGNHLQNSATGLANELAGKVKKNVGKVIGNQEMEARGAATEREGEAQRAANDQPEEGLIRDDGFAANDDLAGEEFLTGEERIASQIVPGLPVVCSGGAQFGEVDHLDGSEIKLSKDDHGVHHFIPLSWVTSVESEVHVDRPSSQATQEWRTEQ